MNIKFDKDALLKQRFWIMLGTSFVLALGGIFYLQLGVDADDARKDLLKDLTAKKNTKGQANEGTIKVMADAAGKAKDLEAKIWSDAYKAQAPIFQWSTEIEKKYDFAGGKFAVEIKLSKVDKAAWPPDTDTLMHGTFVNRFEETFTIQPRKGPPVTFNRTESVEKITVVDENKTPAYSKLEDFGPKRMVAVVYQTGRYFNDVLTIPEQSGFRDSYRDQIHDILKSVDPLDEKGNGVVQLRDWLYRDAPEFPPADKKFIRYVATDFSPKKISKEAWVAQEDLWVQKEVYRMIAEANKEISDFKGNGGKTRNKAFVFQNPNFQIELNLDSKDSLSFKIKNLLDRKQSIDLAFRVQLNDTRGFAPEILRISGKPLNPKGAPEDFSVHTFPAEKSPRNAVLGVQQVLSWQTAAVKRIDQVTIGSNTDGDIAHSHRTYQTALRPFDINDMEGAKPAVGGGPVVGKFPVKGKPVFGEGGGPVSVGGNMGGLENGLWSFRYDEVTEQYRRIPIGVVVIVDQEHVDRVLTSFNNSKLRFLPTQVLLNQYAGSLQPPAPEKKDGGNPGLPFGAFEGIGRPKFGPGGGPNEPAAGGGGADLETNMEIVIYGFMTIYQRYPPAPKIAGGPQEKKI